jgi:hypothetical protein
MGEVPLYSDDSRPRCCLPRRHYRETCVMPTLVTVQAHPSFTYPNLLCKHGQPARATHTHTHTHTHKHTHVQRAHKIIYNITTARCYITRAAHASHTAASVRGFGPHAQGYVAHKKHPPPLGPP